jgi:hypothetical protein
MTQSRVPLSDERESHYVVPGTSNALCAEPTTSVWQMAPDSDSKVTCEQCHLQKSWLPASGELERDAKLDVMIEPCPAGHRRHVTGNDDQDRGRRHRPPDLQICVECCGLRGPYDGYDNLCRCDSGAWDRHPTPRGGDLHDNVRLCMSCVSALAPGSSRWTLYHCAKCLPRVVLLGQLVGRCVVPIGPHSMMNGIYWRSTGGAITAAATAFHDQLITLFQNQTNLYDLTTQRTRRRLDEFGYTAHAVLVTDYLERCSAEKWDAERGYVDFLLSIEEGFDETAARELWNAGAQ